MDGLRTFDGAVVLITGGASGIGAALGRRLAAKGATLVLADRDHEDAKKVAAGLPGAEAAPLDVRDAADFEALVASVMQRHRRLDYLFNNAGTGVGGEVKDYSLDDWRYIVEVNLMGVIHGVQAAYPRMITQGFGHIINTASMAGLMAAPLATVYCSTKHAVVGLSRALRIEAREHGVYVSVLCPGVIRTPILTGGRHGRFTKKVPDAVALKMWDALRPMDVDRFATQVVAEIARNRSIIIVPRWWRLVWWLNRLAPDRVDALAYGAYLRGKAQIESAVGEAR
jgi:NAD(P)-dependent dehydrogenase (short-subunit alcohol dehydrogenase family)